MINQTAQRWNRWLSDHPSGGEPGRFETWSRDASAWMRRHPAIVDSVLALAVAVFTVPQLMFWARQPTAGFTERLVFTILMVTPLIWRRRFPLSMFALAAAIALVQWNLDVTLAADVALLIYLYTVGSRYPLRVSLLAGAVVEVGVIMAALRWDFAGALEQPWLPALLLISAPVAAALLLGISVRSRRMSLAALTDRAEQLERERDQQAALAVAAERTRIAREMHDVVAHGLSVIVTLSDAALLKFAVEPQRAMQAIRQVSATGHEALDEMRRLLGVLRTDSGSHDRQPQPGLDQIPSLVELVRSTGLSATLTITGTQNSLPVGTELTVYRIVQEAITNTLKHATRPTSIRVAVDLLPEEVRVEIHDDGAPGPGNPAGLGLTGMRERAAVYGGAVTAGRDAEGGWRVRAQLPLGSRSADAVRGVR